MKISQAFGRTALAGLLLLSLEACGWGDDQSQCMAAPESKGQAISKKAILQFLRYAGKTHAPIKGDGGTVDPERLEHVGANDLIYDGIVPAGSHTYQFHLTWAPNATFTGAVAPNCSVTTNWSIK
ncbi:hypothetical protein [Asticcacaulis taihuensis]|uniref:hypothetical protein n=1 Tax=Asticcacaulis taihuensis TaxID=260084 RepID=UPI001114681C|nr:hypothetical protein [Asticcacaulis taihuensis]